MSSFQPPPPPAPDPDDALSDLEATFAQVIDPPSIVVVQAEPQPFGKSWSFNWQTMSFDMGNGRSPLETRDLLTLIQWAEKCLRTARGAHPIHPPNYGLVDPKSIFGRPVSSAPIPELEARIVDALTFHPRITAVTDFEADSDPDDEWVALSFTMVVDDDTQLPVTTTLSLTSPGVTS